MQVRPPVRTKSSLQSDKILDAAAHLFGTQRFHEVRMDDIAAEAAVAKGTLYRYFSDKEELYLALLTRASEQFLHRLQAAAAQAETLRERLRAMVTAILVFFDAHPHLFDLIQRAEVLRGPGFPWQKTREELVRLVTNLCDEAKAQGEFIIDDPDHAVLMLLGGLRSVIRFGKQPRPRDLPERIVEAFLLGHDRTSRNRRSGRAEASIFSDPSRL
jgi:AcrR family transcriptional regulator